MSNTSFSSQLLYKLVMAILSLLYLLIISFLYTYLTDLNPIIYFNVIIWLFFSFILIFPTVLLSSDNIVLKILISIVISLISIYLIFGMQSSIFFATLESAIIDDGSMWLPKVDFGDLFSTLLSFNEYNNKLTFLLEYDILSLSFKGSKGVDTGTTFTNFCRIIECLGILVIPIYLHIPSKNEK